MHIFPVSFGEVWTALWTFCIAFRGSLESHSSTRLCPHNLPAIPIALPRREQITSGPGSCSFSLKTNQKPERDEIGFFHPFSLTFLLEEVAICFWFYSPYSFWFCFLWGEVENHRRAGEDRPNSCCCSRVMQPVTGCVSHTTSFSCCTVQSERRH